MSGLFTNLEVRKINSTKALKAFGSVVVAGVVKVNFTILEGRKGLFVKLPSHQGKDKEGQAKWYDDVLWVDEEARDAFCKEALDAYNGSGSSESAPAPKKPTKKSDDSGLPF